MSDITVIIRSSGERTAQVCRSLLEEQVPPEQIHLVKEAPFFQALTKTLEIAVACNRPWTLVVDADLLIREGAISQMLAFAETQADHTLFVSGWCMDKLLCCCRPAGLHLYRTRLLDAPLFDLLESVRTSLRPEHDLITLAGKNLGRSTQIMPPDPLCLHDFEQLFADVYRKAFVHTRKHPDEVSLLLPVWSALAASDPDYRIAMLGYRASRTWPEQIQMDIRTLPREVGPLLAMMGQVEKSPVPAQAWTGAEIASRIVAEMADTSLPLLQRRSGFVTQGSVLAKWRDVRSTLGTVNGLLWVLGTRLRKWGNQISSLAVRGTRTRASRGP